MRRKEYRLTARQVADRMGISPHGVYYLDPVLRPEMTLSATGKRRYRSYSIESVESYIAARADAEIAKREIFKDRFVPTRALERAKRSGK
jgi:hypothetical protein